MILSIEDLSSRNGDMRSSANIEDLTSSYNGI
jgi:hypothetical protein